MKFAVLIFIQFFATSALAGVIPTSKLKGQINSKQIKVMKVMAQIKSMEKKLGQRNDTYLETVDIIKQLGAELVQSQEELKKISLLIDKRQSSLQKAVGSTLLNIDQDEDEEATIEARYYLQLLKVQIKDLKKLKKEEQSTKRMITKSLARLKRYKQNEESLYSLIKELESKKKNLGQEYMSLLEEKLQLEEQVNEREVLAFHNKAKGQPNFLKLLKSVQLPLSGYVSHSVSNKGINFKYKQKRDLLSISSGRVVYTGELAAYGKVIMIDHGNDIRSVFLGNINITVKKMQDVLPGAKIGEAMANSGVIQNLYFEIRKKNIAQNTAQILREQKLI